MLVLLLRKSICGICCCLAYACGRIALLWCDVVFVPFMLLISGKRPVNFTSGGVGFGVRVRVQGEDENG